MAHPRPALPIARPTDRLATDPTPPCLQPSSSSEQRAAVEEQPVAVSPRSPSPAPVPSPPPPPASARSPLPPPPAPQADPASAARLALAAERAEELQRQAKKLRSALDEVSQSLAAVRQARQVAQEQLVAAAAAGEPIPLLTPEEQEAAELRAVSAVDCRCQPAWAAQLLVMSVQARLIPVLLPGRSCAQVRGGTWRLAMLQQNPRGWNAPSPPSGPLTPEHKCPHSAAARGRGGGRLWMVADATYHSLADQSSIPAPAPPCHARSNKRRRRRLPGWRRTPASRMCWTSWRRSSGRWTW